MNYMNYIGIQSSNDVIEHYGIKGMRWVLEVGIKNLKIYTLVIKKPIVMLQIPYQQCSTKIILTTS